MNITEGGRRRSTAFVFMRKPIVSRRDTLRTLLAFLLVACGGAEAGSGSENVTEVQNRNSIEGYPETISVKKGDSIGFMVHSPGGTISVNVVRYGKSATVVHTMDGIQGFPQNYPSNAAKVGCGWKKTFDLTIP